MRYSSLLALAILLLASIAHAQLSQTGMGKVAGGGGPANPCTGTLDLGAGCPLPMLGVF